MSESANIGTLERVETSSLNLYYKNARRGDVETIMESMRHHGVYKPLVVNRGNLTGRKNEVICGNHSLMAVRRLADENPSDQRWRRIDVYMVDVAEDQAARMVLVDNRSSDKADYDVQELVELANSLPDLEATGFTDDELDAMLESLSEQYDEDPTSPEEEETFGLVVECDDREERETLKAQLIAKGHNVMNA